MSSSLPPLLLIESGARIYDDSERLKASIAEWRRQHPDGRIGFTCGAFDLLHAGHADYLERARSLCDRLVVGVNSDASIREYKDPQRPIIGQEHRMRLVASLRSVDAVILMKETRPASLIREFQPDLYIKGGDYQKDSLKSAPIVEAYGGRCVLIPVEYSISTSKIIEKIETTVLYSPVPSKTLANSSPVVFLDRDGTLIENVHFLKDPARVKLLDGVGEGLRRLQDHGFVFALVTNQQGLGLGYFDYDEFVQVNSVLFRQLGTFGVKIAKVYYCPHSFADACACRKPGSELVRRGLQEFRADPRRCFLIGDAASDVEAARGAGCEGILIHNQDSPGAVVPSVQSFAEAVELILASQRQWTLQE